MKVLGVARRGGREVKYIECSKCQRKHFEHESGKCPAPWQDFNYAIRWDILIRSTEEEWAKFVKKNRAAIKAHLPGWLEAVEGKDVSLLGLFWHYSGWFEAVNGYFQNTDYSVPDSSKPKAKRKT